MKEQMVKVTIGAYCLDRNTPFSYIVHLLMINIISCSAENNDAKYHSWKRSTEKTETEPHSSNDKITKTTTHLFLI